MIALIFHKKNGTLGIRIICTGYGTLFADIYGDPFLGGCFITPFAMGIALKLPLTQSRIR